MNWGGFAGGLAGGFAAGIKLGKDIREAEKDYQIKQVAAQGLAEAQASREAERDGRIKETSTEAPQAKAASEVTAPSAAPPAETTAANTTPTAVGITSTPAATDATVTGDPTKAAGEVTPVIDSRTSDVRPSAAAKIATDGAQPTGPAAGITLPFMVEGKGYATREEAKAAADKSVPPVEAFLYKTQYPKMMQVYMEQGNQAGIEKMRTLIETDRGKAATAQYAKGLNMLTSGDIDGGIKEIGKFYNEYVNDGVTWTGGHLNEDGKTLTIKFKGTDGKEGETQMSRGQLARMAMAYNPAKLLEENLLDVKTAEKAASAAAADNAKSARDFKEKVFVQDRAHEQSIEKDAIKDEREAAKPGETGKRIRDLKRSGMFSEDEVKSIIRASSADVGKAPHPQTIAKEVYNKLAASPYAKVTVTGPDGKTRSATFGSLSEEEKQQVVGREVGVIQRVAGGATPSEKGGGTSGGSKPAAGSGLMIYDNQTGKSYPAP